MKKQMTVEDAEFVIKHWPLTAHHRKAAEFILRGFNEFKRECERLEKQVEQLTPPTDSRHIIPIGDHVRIVAEKDRIIGELGVEISKLQRKCAALTLYGLTEPKRPGGVR